MQHPGNWHEVLNLLEDHLLQGSDALPLPKSIHDFFRNLGLPFSDDAAEALLEMHSVAYFMRETSLPDKGISTELAPNVDEIKWTPGELLLIRAVFQAPDQRGLLELAGLLRRAKRNFPEGYLKPLVQTLCKHPEWFGAVADLFDTRARNQLQLQVESSWLFPDGPPDRRVLNSKLAQRHMLHWIWQQPEEMLSWVKNNKDGIAIDWWLSFLEEFGHLLPQQGNELLDVLFPFSENPQAFPVVRSRIVLGNKELRERVTKLWMPMFQMEEGYMRVSFSEPDQEWGDFISYNGAPTNSGEEKFIQLGSCLRMEGIAESMGISIALWCNLAFRSPDSPLWTRVMAEQLRIHPHIEGRLAWLEAQLSYSDGEEFGSEIALMEGLPHDKVSGLLLAAMGGSRPITNWNGLVGQMLTAPSFFWSGALTERVVELMKLRPVLLLSAITIPSFNEAFCWRGQLKELARMVQAPKPLTDLFPESLQQYRDEWVFVIQQRVALYKAFPS